MLLPRISIVSLYLGIDMFPFKIGRFHAFKNVFGNITTIITTTGIEFDSKDLSCFIIAKAGYI